MATSRLEATRMTVKNTFIDVRCEEDGDDDFNIDRCGSRRGFFTCPDLTSALSDDLPPSSPSRPFAGLHDEPEAEVVPPSPAREEEPPAWEEEEEPAPEESPSQEPARLLLAAQQGSVSGGRGNVVRELWADISPRPLGSSEEAPRDDGGGDDDGDPCVGSRTDEADAGSGRRRRHRGKRSGANSRKGASAGDAGGRRGATLASEDGPQRLDGGGCQDLMPRQAGCSSERQGLQLDAEEWPAMPRGPGRSGDHRTQAASKPVEASEALPDEAAARPDDLPPLPLAATHMAAPDSERHGEAGRRKASRVGRLWCHLHVSDKMLRPGFDLNKKIIGKGGEHTRGIYDATGAKIRLRGRGSGHLEHSTGYEAPAPLMLAITGVSGDEKGFRQALRMCVDLLREVERRWIAFCREGAGRRGGEVVERGSTFWIGELSPDGAACARDTIVDLGLRDPSSPQREEAAWQWPRSGRGLSGRTEAAVAAAPAAAPSRRRRR
mmetsp:Transcript_91380/g.263769  ORF Transcript_91380/g.263769 Transcript_91380/m.263769 type:complete len:493 (-) Transcript_91380:104-1582(-)